MHVTRQNPVLHRPLSRVLMLLGILCGLLGGPCLDRRVEAQPAPSNQVVIDWNDVANSVELNPQFFARTRIMAMVGLAIHDAVNAIPGVRRYHTYLPAQPADADTSAVAAVNESAFILLDRYLNDLLARGRITQAEYDDRHGRVVKLYTTTWATLPDDTATSKGIALGTAVADAMWNLRANDGWDSVSPMTPYPYAQIHEAPTHPELPVLPLGAYTIDYEILGLPHLLAPIRWWWGDQQPWAMTSPDQFHTDPPPAVNDPNFLDDVQEVLEVGAINSQLRTADQSQSARWWQFCDAAHPGLMGEELALRFNLDLVESARVMALVTLSMADALISNTNSKNFYNFWRPVTAIGKLGLDTNWTPFLGATIGNQEYPAGHPMVSGGAGVGMLELLFGSGPLVPPLEITTFPSLLALCPNPTRTFTSLEAARLDVVSARVWGGIHFRGSGMEGMRTGQRLARRIYRDYLLPL